MNEERAHPDLAAKYDALAYASKPVAHSHPAHLATVAALFGVDYANVATCRVLELGCGDCSNIIPMAVTMPSATFVGVELAARPVEIARNSIDALGIANIRVEQADLSTLPADFGSFDYIIAHGVYSWVPAPVRDALMALISRHMSPNGMAFVSYNTLPGCHVRRVAWDILRFHTAGIDEPHAKIAAARAFAALLAEPSMVKEGSNALLRHEFERMAEMPDSGIYHDDLAVPNDPVYFREFVAHAGRHGLKFLAETAVSSMSGAGLALRLRQMLATLDQDTREQYLDFARFRRFRQSLLRHSGSMQQTGLSPQRIAGMHVSATLALTRAAAESQSNGANLGLPDVSDVLRALLQWIVEASPQTRSVDEARTWLRDWATRAGDNKQPVRSIEELLLEAYISGSVMLHLDPLPLTTRIADRPVASPFARWQSQHTDYLTNLRHELVRVEDPAARQTLRLLDGSRNRGQLVDALSPTLPVDDRATASSRVDFYLQNFAKLALLMRT